MEIGIVGLGLIGGSLALDLRSRQHTILGVSRRPDTCQQAIARGIVDDASVDLKLMAAADVVFLCTPIHALIPTAMQLIPHLSATTILTDVGSVKQPIIEAIAPLWQNFVGGHPMAGTTESGLDAAQSQLFVNRPYVLTPIETTPPDAVAILTDIVRSLQAQIYHCAPAEHDAAVAWISHLPVMVSANLIAACMHEPNSHLLDLAQKLASSGFRDTSRVGGGNPELGVMMAQYNQQALKRSLQAYREHLDQIIALVEQSDWASLHDLLTHTQQARQHFV